jgi:hypothetical protein
MSLTWITRLRWRLATFFAPGPVVVRIVFGRSVANKRAFITDRVFEKLVGVSPMVEITCDRVLDRGVRKEHMLCEPAFRERKSRSKPTAYADGTPFHENNMRGFYDKAEDKPKPAPQGVVDRLRDEMRDEL